MIRMKSAWVLVVCGLLYFMTIRCQNNMDIRTAQYYTQGNQLYSTHCANCHGQQGEGLAALYPPLTDTTYLAKHRHQLPGIVANGLSGSIIVEGQEYNMEMPANPKLSSVEIAYILTYITNSFGNQQGIFDEEEVESNLSKQK